MIKPMYFAFLYSSCSYLNRRVFGALGREDRPRSSAIECLRRTEPVLPSFQTLRRLRQASLFSLLLASLSIADVSAESKLFVAFAMTKAQQASSLPTDSGIFLQGPGDETWGRIGPVIQAMNSVASDPSDPSTIFIACGNGIVRSRDNGASWRMVTGWRESDFTKIAIDPKNGDNIYAASVWGLSISRDGGESWQSANKGLKEQYCRSVVVDQRNSKRILLGTDDGIYVSRDRAESWSAIRTSPKSNILRMARSGADLDLWIVGTEGEGVFLSRNDGKTWESVSSELSEKNLYAVALHSESASRMAVGGWDAGVWMSDDSGKTWADRSAGLPSMNVTAMSFDPKRADRLWASTFEEGTFYTDDFGKTWKDGNLYGAYVLDLGIIPVE